MIIGIDVGNTNIDFGFFDDEDRFLFQERIPTARVEEILTLHERLRESKVVSSVELVLLASVRPQLDASLITFIRKAFKVTPRRAGHEFGVPICARVEAPERVGIDRLINAWEAHRRTRTATVVASLGTALVVDAVSAGGELLGGAIAPGLRISAAALHEKCAQLPLVDPAPFLDPVGRTTEHAMSVGLFHGLVGAARHLIRQMSESLGGGARVVATGGDAGRLKPYLPEIHDLVPNLTLVGLLHAWRASEGR
ncbi:MAG: type III pantothenate kinase [Candidatus Brocadiae bacterium]|nr:type III pantothenate kinase [Candidatus Brocadiia bacterium]